MSAASSSDLSFSDLTKLSSLETVIYGSSYKNMPSDKRIGSLEKILFGKVQKGPLPTRLAAIVSTVNGQHNNLLSPPIAPELDRSDTLTKTPTPPIAPQAAGDATSFAEEMPTNCARRQNKNHVAAGYAIVFAETNRSGRNNF